LYHPREKVVIDLCSENSGALNDGRLIEVSAKEAMVPWLQVVKQFEETRD
jgi:hypothetical protein